MTTYNQQNLQLFIDKYGISNHDNSIISDIQRLIIRKTFPSKVDYKLNSLSYELFDLLLTTKTKNINHLFNLIDIMII